MNSELIMMTEQEKDSIYKIYNQRIFFFLRSKGLNEADAEDLCENVFVKFYKSLDTFDSSKTAPSTWLYRITNNSLIDFFRTRKIYSELNENLSYIDETMDNILNAETLTELSQALMRLDERERALVVLVYYNDKSLKEAAETLKMSYSNAKIVMKKTLSQLKQFLE